MPKNGPASFTVIHTNGIHDVHVVFCGCGDAVHPRHQLLRRGWFPATIHQPQTCATFVVLNHFHLQTVHSKLTATHFIAALERETDNTGLVTVKVCSRLILNGSQLTFSVPTKDRYVSFLRMSREWRHLMMLKRAGHGHEDSGVKGTQPGSLAILCSACPHPGINLPINWRSVPMSQQYVVCHHVRSVC